jgi:hypothetical protein
LNPKPHAPRSTPQAPNRIFFKSPSNSRHVHPQPQPYLYVFLSASAHTLVRARSLSVAICLSHPVSHRPSPPLSPFSGTGICAHRVCVNESALPSICMYTLFNCEESLTNADISVDGSILAVCMCCVCVCVCVCVCSFTSASMCRTQLPRTLTRHVFRVALPLSLSTGMSF